MNAGAPTCATCGAVNTNPQSSQCRFCGQQLAPQQPPGGGYGAPPGYGPQGYAQPNPYGAPPNPYGAANPYGAPPNPYGQPGYPPVQGFGGVQPFSHGHVPQYRSSGWASGWSTFFWVRLVIVVIAIGVSMMGACISALSH